MATWRGPGTRVRAGTGGVDNFLKETGNELTNENNLNLQQRDKNRGHWKNKNDNINNLATSRKTEKLVLPKTT